MSCEHKRTLHIQAKCSDMCFTTWPSGQNYDGYAPDIEGLCGGDYISFTVCIDCKMIPDLASAEDIIACEPPEDESEESE